MWVYESTNECVYHKPVGVYVGRMLGITEGCDVGECVGAVGNGDDDSICLLVKVEAMVAEGKPDGDNGAMEGGNVGYEEGDNDGACVGDFVGVNIGFVGALVGDSEKCLGHEGQLVPIH